MVLLLLVWGWGYWYCWGGRREVDLLLREGGSEGLLNEARLLDFIDRLLLLQTFAAFVPLEDFFGVFLRLHQLLLFCCRMLLVD